MFSVQNFDIVSLDAGHKTHDHRHLMGRNSLGPTNVIVTESSSESDNSDDNKNREELKGDQNNIEDAKARRRSKRKKLKQMFN